MGDGSWVETRRRGEGVAHLLTTLIAPTTNPNTTHTTELFLFPFSSLYTLCFPLSLSLSLSLARSFSLRSSRSNCHHIVPVSLVPPSRWLAAAASAVGCCLPSCLPADQVVPNTTKSIYLRCTQRPSPPGVFLPLTPFQATPLRGTRTPILIVARTLFTGKAAAAGTIPTG